MQGFIRRLDCCNETRSPWVRPAKCSDLPQQQIAVGWGEMKRVKERNTWEKMMAKESKEQREGRKR